MHTGRRETESCNAPRSGRLRAPARSAQTSTPGPAAAMLALDDPRIAQERLVRRPQTGSGATVRASGSMRPFQGLAKVPVHAARGSSPTSVQLRTCFRAAQEAVQHRRLPHAQAMRPGHPFLCTTSHSISCVAIVSTVSTARAWSQRTPAVAVHRWRGRPKPPRCRGWCGRSCSWRGPGSPTCPHGCRAYRRVLSCGKGVRQPECY